MTATIRGLTLRHPWPRMFLLDDQPKRVENRDWPAPKPMLGQLIALHGGTVPHVTPEFDRADPCPYRLTEAGWAALRGQG